MGLWVQKQMDPPSKMMAGKRWGRGFSQKVTFPHKRANGSNEGGWRCGPGRGVGQKKKKRTGEKSHNAAWAKRENHQGVKSKKNHQRTSRKKKRRIVGLGGGKNGWGQWGGPDGCGKKVSST